MLRGDIPTELSSNHLSDLRPDRLVDAGGTLVNLAVGTLAMFAAQLSSRPSNVRYFLWLVGCFNLMDGAGYFLFSGILGFGDWQEVIAGLPYYVALRIGMSLFGAVLYRFVIKIIARLLEPFCPDRTDQSLYNTVGRLPYYAACAFYCVPAPSILSASKSFSFPRSPPLSAAIAACCGPTVSFLKVLTIRGLA